MNRALEEPGRSLGFLTASLRIFQPHVLLSLPYMKFLSSIAKEIFSIAKAFLTIRHVREVKSQHFMHIKKIKCVLLFLFWTYIVSVSVCVLCMCMCAETRSWCSMSSSVVSSPYCVLTLTCLVRLDIFHVHKQACMSTSVCILMGVFDMSSTPALSLSIAFWNFVGRPLSSWLMSFCHSPQSTMGWFFWFWWCHLFAQNGERLPNVYNYYIQTKWVFWWMHQNTSCEGKCELSVLMTTPRD